MYHIATHIMESYNDDLVEQIKLTTVNQVFFIFTNGGIFSGL